MRTTRGPRGDQGSSLVLALVFLAVLALFVTASLSKAFAMLKVNGVVRARGELQYAADGGVELALHRLRLDRTTTRALCLTPLSGVQTIATTTLGGRPVTYTCETLAGFAGEATDGGYGFAIVTTDPGADSLETQSAVTSALTVTGSVYAAGEMTLAKDLVVEHGDVGQLAGAYCSGTPERLTVTAPYRYACTDRPATDLYPAVAMPVAPVVTNPPYVDLGACRVFQPGRYTTAPALRTGAGRANYFASGVYHLHNLGQWTIPTNAVVVAGQKGPKDADLPGVSACGADGVPNGTGATFVLAGTSRLNVAGTLQVNYRVPLVPAVEGSAAGASVLTVPAGATGWQAWSGTGYATDTANATAAMLFNGKVLAPNAPVALFASNPTVAAARAGVVARRLLLKASASGSSLAVTAETLDPTTGVRSIRVTSTAEGVSGDGGPTVNTAVVDIDLRAPYAVDVRSWRTHS